MTYEETLGFLFSQLPMYQRDGALAYKANLDNTIALDTYFHSPHLKFKTIHVGGTNGKGSVSHMLASVLQQSGYKTGLYTSPHLKDFRERIRINGEMIPETEVIHFVDNHHDIIKELKPSFFEMTVAMAFKYFADKKVDIAVIEVGMGGRLDSTNIIHPLVSVVTNISYDHTQFLGDTLSLIAAEKAGIIKPKTPVIIGERHYETDKVFEELAKKQHAHLIFAEDKRSVSNWKPSAIGCEMDIQFGSQVEYRNLLVDLGGIYQQKNILTVLATIDVLSEKLDIPKSNVELGIKNTITNTSLKGRWQKLASSPLTICDTGHNQDGIEQVLRHIKLLKFNELHFVLGMVNDKDHTKILSLLPKHARYYFTRASIPRALNEKTLQQLAFDFGLQGEAFENVPKALKAAKASAKPEDLIFIGGSTFVVADIPEL